MEKSRTCVALVSVMAVTGAAQLCGGLADEQESSKSKSVVGASNTTAREHPARDAVKQIHRLAVLQGHQDQVRQVEFSPDGTILASCSDDHSVKLWDVASEKPLATLQGHADHVY